MDHADGRRKLFIDKKFILYTAGFVAFITVLLIGFWFINVQASKPYANCSELFRATGRKDIPLGDSLYNPAMDRNHNGVSCE